MKLLKDKKIFLLRHGETEYNKLGKYQGILDSPLTEVGVRQVRENAMLLKRKLDIEKEENSIKFYSSPLGRAKASAEIIRTELGLTNANITFDNDLEEVNIGSWNGKNVQEVRNNEPDVDAFNWYFCSPDGENYTEVIKRCKSWINTVEQAKEETIIVMSHGLLGRVLRGCLVGLDYKESIYLDVPQKGFFEIHNHRMSYITDDFEVQ
ncbi:histidine phosphatase family protein [Enterococcus sp. AZ126]|uniref:histidine phosphatase family protein n=1 Tax=Enterococcus sp. AZ126 TaxID=2774635 RepID=UPI003F27564A